MGQINFVGVLKGGLAAAVLMNISQYILNLPVAGTQMAKELAARNLPPAVGAGQIAVFAVSTTVLGFITIFVYAAIRPRLGPGPMTAMAAGLVVTPGVAERAVLELTTEERQELTRLLKAELTRAKS